jgi:tetratricopeptide (TPR) repeat protein
VLAGAGMTAMLTTSWLSPAFALTDEDWDSCARAAEFSSDRPIRGCTAVIKAAERILAQLVAAHNNRGVALLAKSELDRAIMDFDRVIQLKPDYLAAFARAAGYGHNGLLDRAIADLDVIIKADPKKAALIRERGTMKAKIGDWIDAEADSRRAEASGGNPPPRSQ